MIVVRLSRELLAAVLLLCALSVGSPAADPQGTDLEAFDFLLGEWQGQAPGSGLKVSRIFDGTVFEEIWTEQHFSAVVLRSWDGERWHLTFVARGSPPQVWEGRKEGGLWRFYREWKLEGQSVLSRTYWLRKPDRSFERVVEQSRDHGASWTEHVRAAYRRRDPK